MSGPGHRASRVPGIAAGICLTLPLIGSWSLPADAGGDLARQSPVEVTVWLGDADDAMRFHPDVMEFESGRLYRLVLHNPSSMSHYFSSPGFARAIYTRKVQVRDADGHAAAEVKGTITEVEVFPRGTAEWWFVPIRTVRLAELKCTIEGHAALGMVGRITIN